MIHGKKAQAISKGVMVALKILFIIMPIILFVALTVGSVFSSKQDVRPLEAVLLSKQILDCISKQGIINETFDVNSCYLDDGVSYYANATIYSMDSQFSKSSTSKANTELETGCRLGNIISKAPSCLNQTSYVLISRAGRLEKGKLEILVGVKKYDENI